VCGWVGGGGGGGGGECEKVIILLRGFPCFLMNFHLWTDPLSSTTPLGWHHKCCHLHSTSTPPPSTQKKDKSLNDWW